MKMELTKLTEGKMKLRLIKKGLTEKELVKELSAEELPKQDLMEVELIKQESKDYLMKMMTLELKVEFKENNGDEVWQVLKWVKDLTKMGLWKKKLTKTEFIVVEVMVQELTKM